MPDAQLPPGRYLTCTWEVKGDGGGGQTRVLLQRNRMVCRAGFEPRILSFVAVPDIEQRRTRLLERRLLLPGMRLDTIFDHYREHDWSVDPDPDEVREPLTDLRKHTISEELRPDGTPWRTTYEPPRSENRVYDYQRADGSTYLRIPHFAFSDPASWPRLIQRVSREGEVLGSFNSLSQWFRGWVREVAEDERAFVFLETRVLTPHLSSMKAPNIHLIQVMHNVHTQQDHRWDGPVAPLAQKLLDRMDHLDAVVTLTERQREDLQLRRGATNNLFVIPNPVEMPASPSSGTRDPRLVTIVARLATQKRLHEAVLAFEKVLDRLPDARLEIFGDGPSKAQLRELVDERGLGSSVILRGFDPQARTALEHSSAFLMTSRNEGYPMATLESMSHGCPVVSYDIKYGPREQISDGVNGFLVPDGDRDLMAERVVQLLTSPQLVARLSGAARETAAEHSLERYEREWAEVLHTVASQKEHRTLIRAADLEVTRLELGRLGRLTGRDAASPVGAYGDDVPLRLAGVLRIQSRGTAEDLDTARVELAAVRECGGEVVELPVTAVREGKDFRVSARFPVGSLLGEAGSEERAYLRLRLVWENSAWQTRVGRPTAGVSRVEVAFRDDDSLVVQRRQVVASTEEAVSTA